MRLLCDECGSVEDIVLKDGLILFECRNVRVELPEDLDDLFKKYGGER